MTDHADPRIDALLAQMTLEEKAGQLTQYFSFPDLGDDVDPAADNRPPGHQQGVEREVAAGRVGSLLFVHDAAETNRLQRIAAGSRLGVPLLFGFDVVHGLRTIFPVPIALAASWDPAIAEEAQRIAAREARAIGLHWSFAPMVDIARDPRWGRMIEGAGEDPVLGAAMAAAQVRGFQGETLGAADRIVAGPKHFAGYGYAVGGRDYDEVELADATLWNVVLPPFRAAIEAGAANIMSAYMDVNGVPATGNPFLLTDVLRDALGFDGFVVSDAKAVIDLETHGFAKDAEDAAVRAIHAGVDMEMAFLDAAFEHLPDAVRAGRITEAALDTAVRRVLSVKARLGLLDGAEVDEDRAREVLADPAHREASRAAAARSAVLLKNDGVLPLAAPRSIAVLGPLADSTRDVIGPWVFDFDLDETVSVLEGIQAAAGDATVSYAPGVRAVHRLFPSIFDMFGGNAPDEQADFDDEAELNLAVEAATGADVAIVVVGEWQNQIGENASRSSLALPGEQQRLVEAVTATGTPVVLVVMNGRPLDLRWADEHVAAILDVWYPGTHGGHAVADLLFGRAVPGGKLPFSWPRTVGQVPMTYSRTISHDPANQAKRYWDEESTPLYPFGYGQSYTTFAFTDLALDADAVGLDGTVTASVTVTNTGSMAGDAVAQLYLHQRTGRASRPVRELKGFERIALEAGEARTLRFRIGPAERRYWSAAEREVVLDAAGFDVWVGGDSAADLHAEFTVQE